MMIKEKKKRKAKVLAQLYVAFLLCLSHLFFVLNAVEAVRISL